MPNEPKDNATAARELVGATAAKTPIAAPPPGTRPLVSPAKTPAKGSGDKPASKEKTGEKILGKFDDQAGLEKGYTELEGEHGKARARLSRLEDTLESLSGLSDYIEIDQLSGKARIRPEKVQELTGADGSDVSNKTLKEALVAKFKEKGKENPSEALVEIIFEAAEHIAGQKVASVRGDVQQVGSETRLVRFLNENPEMEPLVPYVENYFKRQPAKVRAAIDLEDAFAVVKHRLAKSGKLEDIGFKEPGKGTSGRKGDRLTSGDSPALEPGDGSPTLEEQHEAVRQEILSVKDPLDDFFQKSGKDGTKGPFSI
jgi:hypothetical protein